MIAKYDLKGKMVSYKKYVSSDDIGFSSIAYDEDYLYVIGSKTNGEESKKALIVKYDYDLNKEDEVIYGTKYARYNKLLLDGDKLIVVGIEKKKNYNGIISMYSKDLEEIDVVSYGNDDDSFFTDVIKVDGNYVVCGYSSYKRNYLTKFITYSNALKVLEAK